MIHNYSLIHDDLPAMDDDLRWGHTINHSVYGETTSILSGDGSLTGAFILLSTPDIFSDLSVGCFREVIYLLAKSSGSHGLVGGQACNRALYWFFL